jgi:hypothetical protein
MQTADNKPGEYYVSVVHGPRKGLLLGPFTNNHQAALDMVDTVRTKAEELDAMAVFYAFGTVRLNDHHPVHAGSLNRYFGLPTERA